MSIDAETNGLWGRAFALAAVLKDEDGKIKEFKSRCPIEGEINEWVENNVLPQLEDMPITRNSYKEMLEAFSKFYLENKDNCTIIVHVGFPVEARVFADMHEFGLIGDWDAPFPLTDISAIPAIGLSVDEYNMRHGIEVPFKGSTHHPLYDAWAALVAYEDYMI